MQYKRQSKRKEEQYYDVQQISIYSMALMGIVLVFYMKLWRRDYALLYILYTHTPEYIFYLYYWEREI
jgi:hypothetical protein